MPERFIATFIPQNTSYFNHETSEVGSIADITMLHGLNPENCLYRGYSRQESVSRAVTTGDDSPVQRGWTYAMEVKRRKLIRRGTYRFRGDLVSPMRYTMGGEIAGISLYDKSKLKKGRGRYQWEFREGIMPRDALLGIIIVQDPIFITGPISKLRFNHFVSSMRRKIRE